MDSLGRSGRWNGMQGNPVISAEIDIYLHQIKGEQSVGHVMQKQAKPLSLRKLQLIGMYIDRHIDSTKRPDKLFILARDQAFFKLLYFGGDRAHDLGIMLTQEIKSLPADAGFVIKHTYGKTHSCSQPKVFSIYRCEDKGICPVVALEQYMDIAKKLNIDLNTGYLFRPVVDNLVRDDALSYSCVYERLKFYLGVLQLDEGETPHSFRGACALSFKSNQPSESLSSQDNLQRAMCHIGWRSAKSAAHYARHAQIDQAQRMAHRVSDINNYAVGDHSYPIVIEDSSLRKAFTS